MTSDDRSIASDALRSAVQTVQTETTGLTMLAAALANELAAPFTAAVNAMRSISGRIIVTGVGKSGHIGSKIAATLASTGTPAFFVHPAEANHGDLGMIARDDVILALSWSGESAELRGILAYSRRFAIPLIAMTAGENSTLARECDIRLLLPVAPEACPHGLAPTTSTVMNLALGDALAVALLETRGFSASDFHTFHPGGKLGATLTAVDEIMHCGNKLPLAAMGTLMSEAIIEMTSKGFGCVGIIDEAGKLKGIITDGDLRRHMGSDLLSMAVEAVMTARPKTLGRKTLAATALSQLNRSKITTVFVVENQCPCGIVHLHDLLRIGVA
jgi:arabinose-5-phosphate isomerase